MGMGLLFKLSRSWLAGEWLQYHLGIKVAHAPFEGLLHEGGALHSISWIVGSISVSSLEFDQVINILKVSLFLGILHLLAAMILRVRRNLKEGDKIAAYS